MDNSAEIKIRNLKKVLAVNAQLSTTLDLGALLEIIMKTAAEVMNTQAASLLLIDSQTQDLIFQVALGDKGGELKEKFRIKMGEGIAGSVAQTGQSLVVNDVSKDPRFAKRFDASTGFVTKSILCVPMFVREKIIGVLQAINPLDESPFSAEDLFLFETFSGQAAIAVENARMHSEIVKQERTKQDLKIASAIQQNFLPDLSHNPCCVDIAAQSLPAREVGGDFYDAFPLDCRTAGILIGDVSGKGIPAALFMVRAISEFRFLAHKIRKPAELMNALNAVLSKNSPFGMFVTMLYLTVDLKNKKLSYCSAGHHAIIKRDGTGQITALENVGGPPAGLAEDSGFRQNEIVLNSGDVFFIYTDGVTEARSKTREEYGTERLKKFAQTARPNAGAYTEGLLADLRNFTTGAEPHDDITILTVTIP